MPSFLSRFVSAVFSIGLVLATLSITLNPLVSFIFGLPRPDALTQLEGTLVYASPTCSTKGSSGAIEVQTQTGIHRLILVCTAAWSSVMPSAVGKSIKIWVREVPVNILSQRLELWHLELGEHTYVSYQSEVSRNEKNTPYAAIVIGAIGMVASFALLNRSVRK